MPTIEISQQFTKDDGSFEVMVTIAGAEYQTTVKDPFSPEEELDLEWYFQEWIRFPFVDTAKAENAAKSVRTYGERLFEQVFSGNARVTYATFRNPLADLKIEIRGDPSFQRLHWETMWEPDHPRPLAVEGSIMRKRRVRGIVMSRYEKESPVLNLLIVTARPNEGKDIGYRTITRPMVDAVRNANLRVDIDIVRPGTYEAFVRQLESRPEGFYRIVHFDMHGDLMKYNKFLASSRSPDGYTSCRPSFGLEELERYDGVKAFLKFEGEECGSSVPVSAEELTDRLQGRGVRVCVLNACQSGKQVSTGNMGAEERETSLGARLMDAGMQLVISMGYSVRVRAAKMMMTRVYENLFVGNDVSAAVRKGRKELYEMKQRVVYYHQRVNLEDWMLPVVYGNEKIDFKLRQMTFEEDNKYLTKRAFAYHFVEPRYGFVGRDLDILKLEKGLLRSKIMLLQGMGGSGKTTLLRYLQEWWVTTSFVECVFYFDYDEKAWTLEQLILDIGKEMFSDIERRRFQAMGYHVQIERVLERLRSRRFALMFDNLESVNGNNLAGSGSFSTEERNKIQSFLQRLGGGSTFVLLGSRSPETWLRSEHEQNRHVLRGLDVEARSELARKVVDRAVTDTKRRGEILKDADFIRLNDILAGHPLAIKVVLSNLNQKLPSGILQSLNAADVSIDHDGNRSESMLKCVEISFSNLSAPAQKLLLCLAPFTGIIDRKFLELYFSKLSQVCFLEGTEFRQLESAIKKAMEWGLLECKVQDDPSALNILPIFPYYLRGKLAQQSAEDVKLIHQAFSMH